MRVLQIGADRSKRGILVPGSPAHERQRAYARIFGALDIIGFSLKRDGFAPHIEEHLHTYPTNSRSRFFYLFDAIRIATKLPWPEVVSAQDPFETGLVALLIARILRIPLHVQVHTDFLSPAYARLSVLNRLRVVLAGFVLRRATRIRVVSNRIKMSLEKRYRRMKTPITVLPIFVDLERYRSTAPSVELQNKFSRFSHVLLYAGRLEREKHPCLAIDAFAAAAPLSACLVVVGSGSERAALEARVRRYGLQDRVFFEGEREALPYFAHADLVLVPSRYEGYGLVIIEALAAGKPVLATDVGVAREAGALVASERDYADALKKWFAEGPTTATLKAYPYRNFEDYSRHYGDDIAACSAVNDAFGGHS